MKTYKTKLKGRYIVWANQDGTITTPNGVILCRFKAWRQWVFIATDNSIQCSVDGAVITAV